YVYAASEWNVFGEQKCKIYNFAKKDCGTLCSKETGAQKFYCTLGCSQNSTSDSDYETCKQSCTGAKLTTEQCKIDCQLTVGSRYICNTVCDDNVPASLPRCLFFCGEKCKEKCVHLTNKSTFNLN
ncbi:unnamed protein product, partial [Trichobilharzia szidati]